MSDELRVQRYTDADRAGVVDLMRDAFSEDYAQHLDAMWDWKYGAHPLNREAEQVRRANHDRMWSNLTQNYSEDIRAQWGLTLDDLNPVPDDAPYVLLLKDGDKVAAMEGSLPRAILINGERHLASIGCDLAVHPNYRGRQLSMRLAIRTMSEHRLALGWYNTSSWASTGQWQKKTAPALRQIAHPNPPASGKIRLVALVKPIDWPYMLERATGIRLPASIAALAGAGANRISALRTKQVVMPGVEVFKLEIFDSRFDDLWQRCSHEHQVIGIRDREYLNWRFNSRPDGSYICLAAACGMQIIGYLVYRIVERDGGRSGYIVDFLAEGEPNLAFAILVSHAEDLMVWAGVQSIVCLIAKATYRRVLHQAGFYPAVRGVRSYVTAEVSVPDAQVGVYADLPKWFLTMADGDAEMAF